MSTFSQRHGFEQPDAPITIRSEAPEWLRSVIIQFAYDVGQRPSDLREMLCRLLLESPDPSNWSEFPNVDNEVRGLLSQAEWFRVYDLIEMICERLRAPGGVHGYGLNEEKTDEFAGKMNDAFRRKGVGWQLVDGHIEIRGGEWCERVNELPPDQRNGRAWNYCLLGEALFYEFRDKGATMEEILQFARVRAKAAEKQSLFG